MRLLSAYVNKIVTITLTRERLNLPFVIFKKRKEFDGYIR
jgi:hypothetical protein